MLVVVVGAFGNLKEIRKEIGTESGRRSAGVRFELWTVGFWESSAEVCLLLCGMDFYLLL